MNGREYLARQMDKHDMTYTRSGNCFPDIENLVKAQRGIAATKKNTYPQIHTDFHRLISKTKDRLKSSVKICEKIKKPHQKIIRKA